MSNQEPTELTPIINNSSKPKKNPILEFLNRGTPYVRFLAAAPAGAGSWYATFGPIAMMYAPGMWLVVPVATGAVISVSEEIVQQLAKKYPQNKLLQSMSKLTFFLDKGVNGFMADFGFTWGMLNSLSRLGYPVNATNNEFAKTWSKFIAAPIACFNRLLRYQEAKKGESLERGMLRHTGTAYRGMVSTVGGTSTLSIQGIIPANSWISPALVAVTGIMGFVASLVKESKPVLYTMLISMINMVCENPSLAMTFFTFPNNIYAAEHDGSIPEEFFYANASVSGIFLVLLTMMSVSALFEQPQITQDVDLESTSEEYSDEEYSDEEDSEQEDDEEYVIPVNPTDSNPSLFFQPQKRSQNDEVIKSNCIIL